MSWVYSNPLKASIFHLNRNADFRHEFPGVVGDAVVNQGDFPGKSSDCHVMLHTVVPVPRRRVCILRCEKSHIFIMTQAAYTDVEQTRHIPMENSFFSLIPYPPIASVFRPAFFVITANAITQIITDRREPVAVASPIGNSVVGKSLEVR